MNNLKIMSVPKIYRGWWVLLGLMLVYAVTNGILIFSMPLLYPVLIDEFGWSAVEVTIPATVFFIFAAVTAPPAGVLLDRYSPRAIMMVGAFGVIIGLALFPFVTALWHLVGIFIVFGISLSLCGLIANMLLVTRWFDRRRGRATGMLLMASSLGGALFPLVIGAGIGSYGWRGALAMLSIIAAVIIFPSLMFLILDKPRSTHENDSPNEEPVKLAKVKRGPSLRDALKQPTFYLVALATGAIWFAVIAHAQHQTIYLTKEVGIDRNLLPVVMSMTFACSILGKIGFGWLSDYYDKNNTLMISVLVFILGLLMFRNIESGQTTFLFAYAAIAGIGFSGAFTSIQLVIAQYFASPSYGKILAVIVLIDSLAGALGTRIIADIRQSTGSYFQAIDTMVGACVIAILFIFVIKKINSTKSAIDTIQAIKE